MNNAAILFKKEEAILIKKAQRGNLSAFTTLEELNRNKVKGTIVRFCGSSLGDDVHEVYQTAIIKSWQKIKSFKRESSFATWATRIGINLVKDRFRSSKYRNTISIETFYVGGADQGKSQEIRETAFLDLTGRKRDLKVNASRGLEIKELRVKLNKTLDTVSPEHKEVLVMHIVDQMNYNQIAKKLKVPVGTIMSRLFYARKSAQKIFLNIKESTLAA